MNGRKGERREYGSRISGKKRDRRKGEEKRREKRKDKRGEERREKGGEEIKGTKRKKREERE